MVNPRRPIESDSDKISQKSRLDDDTTQEASSLDLEDDDLEDESLEDDDKMDY